MLREYTASADSIEEAIAIARNELGIGDDVGDIDILDMPEKKVLGLFGGKKAKVRVFYDDGKSAPKPVKTAKPQKAAQAPKAAKKDAPKKETAKKEAPKKVEKAAEKPAAPINKDAQEKCVNYIKDILSYMDAGDYTLEVNDFEGGFCINLTGDKLGVVIGRRGETLDALQYLVSLCYNNNESGYTKVVLDANNYRAKREVTLAELAKKVADQVVKSGRNESLEPMNPYERRVIHTAIQEIDGLTSWSVSDGRDRRVIIGLANEDGTPVDPNFRPMRRSSGRGDRRRGSGRPRRDSYKKSSEPSAPKRDKISDAGEIPLFGRIDK